MIDLSLINAQRNGIEDRRVARFHNDKRDREWLGTYTAYTAYSGSGIQSEL